MMVITGMHANATSKCKGGASSPLLPLQLASYSLWDCHAGRHRSNPGSWCMALWAWSWMIMFAEP